MTGNGQVSRAAGRRSEAALGLRRVELADLVARLGRVFEDLVAVRETFRDVEGAVVVRGELDRDVLEVGRALGRRSTMMSRIAPRVTRTSFVSAAGGNWKCIPRRSPCLLKAMLAWAITVSGHDRELVLAERAREEAAVVLTALEVDDERASELRLDEEHEIAPFVGRARISSRGGIPSAHAGAGQKTPRKFGSPLDPDSAFDVFWHRLLPPSMSEREGAAANESVHASFNPDTRKLLRRAGGRLFPLQRCPACDLSHCSCRGLDGSGRHDIAVDAGLDEIVSSPYLIRRDHRQAVRQALVHHEPPGLVVRGNDERVGLGIDIDQGPSVDVAERAYLRIVSSRLRDDVCRNSSVSDDAKLTAVDEREGSKEDIEPLAFHEPADEEEACLRAGACRLARPVGARVRVPRSALSLFPERGRHPSGRGRARASCRRQAGVGRTHEVSHPGIRQPPRPRRLRTREAPPPRHEGPVTTAWRGERRQVGGRGPDPASAGNDDVGGELGQRSEWVLGHIDIGVEPRPEPRADGERGEIERPRVEEDVLERQIALRLPASVTLHRRFRDDEELALLALCQALEERLRVGRDHVDDDRDTHGLPPGVAAVARTRSGDRIHGQVSPGAGGDSRGRPSTH